MLDGPGGSWTPVIPPGSRCPVCFAGLGDERVTSGGIPPRRRLGPTAAGLSGIAALSLVTFFWVGGLASEAVVLTLATPTPTAFPSASAGIPTRAPGPSRGSPRPTVVPEPTLIPGAPTPAPSNVTPIPTDVIPTTPPLVLPTLPPIVQPTPIIIIIYPPAPTLPPIPVATCLHPGEHLGADACKWPHN